MQRRGGLYIGGQDNGPCSQACRHQGCGLPFQAECGVVRGAGKAGKEAFGNFGEEGVADIFLRNWLCEGLLNDRGPPGGHAGPPRPRREGRTEAAPHAPRCLREFEERAGRRGGEDGANVIGGRGGTELCDRGGLHAGSNDEGGPAVEASRAGLMCAALCGGLAVLDDAVDAAARDAEPLGQSVGLTPSARRRSTSSAFALAVGARPCTGLRAWLSQCLPSVFRASLPSPTPRPSRARYDELACRRLRVEVHGEDLQARALRLDLVDDVEQVAH